MLTEVLLVLGVSLGASAVYAVLSLIRKLTEQVALNQQTTAMNQGVTPDRPWLDLAYQLAGVGLGVVPALLAIHLLLRDDPQARHHVGADLSRPWRDTAYGVGLAALVGIPGLGFYLLARAAGVNTTIAAANLGEHWWTVPVLVLASLQNAVLEEVVAVAYLVTRLDQAGWRPAAVLAFSAVLRGTYHLYQGFGGFLGNIAMGVLFVAVYRRTGRVAPLVIAHALIDIVAFVGYSALHGQVSWL